MQALIVDRTKNSYKLFEHLRSRQGSVEETEKAIIKICAQIYSQLRSLRLRNKGKLTASELVVVLVESKEAKKLNKQYRGRDYATDVLSFDDEHGLGELVICTNVILRQAREHGLTAELELTYMILHGVLHLLGYDHEVSKLEEKRMFAIQDRIFAKIENANEKSPSLRSKLRTVSGAKSNSRRSK